MAKFVLGAIITNIAGSVGGTTLRRVPNGLSMYNKIRGTSKARLLKNPQLPAIGQIFQRWSQLSDSDRAGWNAQALLVTFPDKFGNQKNLTGRELFSKANIQLLPTGASLDSSSGFTTVVNDFTLGVFVFDISTPTFQVDVESLTGGNQIMISVELTQKPILQPVFKSREVIHVGDIEAPSANIQFPTAFLAKFPYATAGMWLTVYAQAINGSGMVSPYQFVSGQIMP